MELLKTESTHIHWQKIRVPSHKSVMPSHERIEASIGLALGGGGEGGPQEMDCEAQGVSAYLRTSEYMFFQGAARRA